MDHSKPSTCPQCGVEVAPNDRFCGECGSEIVVTSPAVETSPATPAPPAMPAPNSKPKKSKRRRWVLMAVLIPIVLGLVYFMLPVWGDPGFVQSLAISPDGTRLASGGENGTIMIWRLPEGTLQMEIDHEPTAWRLMFNQQGDRLAVVDDDDVLTVYTLTNNIAQRDWAVDDTSIMGLGMDGEDVFTVDTDGKVRLWSQKNSLTGQVIGDVKDPNGTSFIHCGIDEMAFSPGARRMAITYLSQYDRVRFFLIEENEKLEQWEVRLQGGAKVDTSQHGDVEGVVYSCDGDRVALYNGNEVPLYDAWRREHLSTAKLMQGYGDCPMVLDRRMQHAIVGAGYGYVQLFDLNSGEVSATFVHAPAWYRKLQSFRSYDSYD